MEDEKLSLGSESILKLLWRFALPSIIAMTAASLYNILDSIFIGHGVGHLGIAALAICFPIMNLTAAFGAMVGVGATTVASMKMGQRDYKGAEEVLGNVVLLNLIIGIALTIVCLIFIDPIPYFFGASENTLPYAREYMKIILYANVINHSFRGLSDMMRASGYPQKSMYLTLLSVAINAVLGYLFVLVFNWGIAGAAWATVIGQVVALIYVIVHFCNKNNILHFKRHMFKLNSKIARNIMSIGLAPFLINSFACLIVMLINTSLKKYGGDLYISAYGVINRTITFFMMIVMGFNQGMQPIVGYNFGAQKLDRVITTYKYTLICAISINTLGFILCQFFPDLVIKMFTTHEELIELCRHALRITSLTLPIIAFQMVSTNFFQSMGYAKKAIFLSTNRQLLFLIPFLIILPRFFGADGVWMSIPSADIIAVIVSLVMIILQFRKFKRLRAAQEAKEAIKVQTVKVK